MNEVSEWGPIIHSVWETLPQKSLHLVYRHRCMGGVCSTHVYGFVVCVRVNVRVHVCMHEGQQLL